MPSYRVPEDSQVECPVCHTVRSPKGIASHVRSHGVKYEKPRPGNPLLRGKPPEYALPTAVAMDPIRPPPTTPPPTPPPAEGRGRRARARPRESRNPVPVGAQYTFAQYFAATPRRVEMFVMFLWQAKLITEMEWGWPVMETGQWLDNYLVWSMDKFGYEMGAYKKREDLPPEMEPPRARGPMPALLHQEDLAPTLTPAPVEEQRDGVNPWDPPEQSPATPAVHREPVAGGA